MRVTDEPRRFRDPGVPRRGVDGSVDDRLDRAAPWSSAVWALGASSDEDAAEVGLRGARVVYNGHDLVDVDDDEVLRLGMGQGRSGRRHDKAPIVEEL